MSVWLEEDPVHLTASAYKDIASLVKNQAELAVHCPKFLQLSHDILRSVDATKWNGAELLGLFFRITFWTDLWFLNEFHNILRNSLWFC